MKVVALLASAFLANFAQVRSPSRITPPPVARLCGKLVHVDRVPDKDIQNAFEARTKSLPRVSVRLYGADGDRSCCEGLPLVGEATTGRWGSFRLNEKGLAGGLYWIAARRNARQYQLLVRFEPRKNSTESCSDLYYEVDDLGNMTVAVTLVVE